MKQYEFQLLKQGAIHTVYCTAHTPAIALQAVKDKYAPEFKVTRLSGEFPPHRSYAEIDASMITAVRRNPKRRAASRATLAAHARAVGGKRKTRKNPTATKMPNRGYYIVQTDMSYGGYEYGIDAVTPIPWRVWRTTRILKGYTFQIPPVVYDKPGFKEWAQANSGPGYPLFATLNQLRAMTKAFLTK